jgi:membrane protease YdiL (CAAX protease family)
MSGASRAAARPFWVALFAGWVLLAAAGVWYAGRQQIPPAVAAPLVAAFLLEYGFYLIPGFRRVREAVADRLPVLVYAALLTASAVLPYGVACLAGGFQPAAFVRLLILTGVISFWYVFRRPAPSSDVAMLLLLAAIMLSKIFKAIYVFPVDERVDVLGQFMLIRLAVMVMLTIREVHVPGFGFWPTRSEWLAGLRWCAWLLPAGLAAGSALRLLEWAPNPAALQLLPLQFLGALWVIAYGEEFFFRALLQQWIEDRTGKPWLAIAAASILFGAAHLPFRQFPNWKFAIVAAIAGVFYGLAYRSGFRAAMAAHAITATLLKTFFRMV